MLHFTVEEAAKMHIVIHIFFKNVFTAFILNTTEIQLTFIQATIRLLGNGICYLMGHLGMIPDWLHIKYAILQLQVCLNLYSDQHSQIVRI